MGAQTSTHYLNAHISSRARGCDVPFIQLLVNELRLKCTKCFLRKKCTASHFQVEVLIKWCNYDGIKLRKSHRQGPTSSQASTSGVVLDSDHPLSGRGRHLFRPQHCPGPLHRDPLLLLSGRLPRHHVPGSPQQRQWQEQVPDQREGGEEDRGGERWLHRREVRGRRWPRAVDEQLRAVREEPLRQSDRSGHVYKRARKRGWRECRQGGVEEKRELEGELRGLPGQGEGAV